MNSIHDGVVRHIRRLSVERETATRTMFSELSDEQIVKLMFRSYRGRGSLSRGLRLTESGLAIMVEHFKYFEVEFPSNRRIQSNELIYLDRNATLPYFCSSHKIVVFETILGMKVALWDGEVARLCEIEGL